MKLNSAIIFFFIFMVLCNCFFFKGFGFGEESCSLNFHEVIINPQSNSDLAYEMGKKIYPEYHRFGLPKNFLIKKEADLSIDKRDIEQIDINKDEHCLPGHVCYVVVFTINPSKRHELAEYTKSNVHNRIALEVNGNIFSIATVAQELSSTLAVPLIDIKLEEIKKTIAPLSIKAKEGMLTPLENEPSR